MKRIIGDSDLLYMSLYKNTKTSHSALLLVLWAFALSICSSAAGLAQDADFVHGSNLVTEGIPNIPASLVKSVKRYSGIYELPLAGWDPVNLASGMGRAHPPRGWSNY